MENYIVIGILVLLIGGAALYVYRAKKKGKRCIGCGSCANCSAACGIKASDNSDENEKQV